MPTQALRALGITVEAQTDWPVRLLRVALPPGKLRELAELPGVRFIRRPYRPVPLAFALTPEPERPEALGPIGALPFHAQGFRGQGVKLAVIDVGFGGLSWAIQNRALPEEAIADATDYSGEGLEVGPSHGTAVAELVHRVAPRALLYLKKVSDEVDLARAVDDCLREGIQIIVHAVGWVNTNFTDGTGIVDEIAERAAHAGILWVNAAGNHARQHWQGPCRDDDRDGWCEFAPGEEALKLRASLGQVQLFLTWDDWPRTCQDYDLFLYDAQGDLIASSQGYQSCSEPPTEELEHLVLSPGSGVLQVRVLARNRLNPVAIKLFSFGGELEPAVPQGSLLAPADALSVLAVGAIPLGRWETGPQEPFSSQGPTSDGRTKPDIAGPDNVWTFTEVGFLHRFRGTSAAAPHVAGAAALLLSRHPGWSAMQLWRELERQAVDLGPPGKDNIYGAGRLSLSLGPPQATRTIETEIRPGDKVIQGGSFKVRLRVRMPPFHFGGLAVKEELPRGFEIELESLPELEPGADADVNGARFDPLTRTGEWRWPLVPSGAARELEYRVRVARDQPPGSYKLEGTINGEPIAGESSIEVIPPLSPAEAVARWDPQAGVIDLTRDGRIDEAELRQAVRWWLEDAEVPGTAGQSLSSGEMEELIARWLAGIPVGQLLPAMPARPAPVEATREISALEEGGSESAVRVAVEVEVEVRVRAHARVLGLRLVESWGAGWRLEPLELPEGAVFKPSAGSGAGEGEWLLLRAVEPGERVRFAYRAFLASGDAEPLPMPVLPRGVVSSALPRFALAVGGTERVSLDHEPDPELKPSPAPVPELELELKPELEVRSLRAYDTGDALLFSARGRGLAEMRVELFTLAGRRLAAGEAHGGLVALPKLDEGGRPLASGVYLYVATIRGYDGSGRVVRLPGKVVILRR